MLLVCLNPEGSVGFVRLSRLHREALTICPFPSLVATADSRFCEAASPVLVFPDTKPLLASKL